MATHHSTGFCKVCQQQRLMLRDGANHLLHLVLTVLTGGLWLIVWIGCSVQFGGWRCSQCGHQKREFDEPNAKRALYAALGALALVYVFAKLYD